MPSFLFSSVAFLFVSLLFYYDLRFHFLFPHCHWYLFETNVLVSPQNFLS